MDNLEYTVLETVTTLVGKIIEIVYEIEEITVETISTGIISKKERRSRLYTANIARQQYNVIAQKLRNALSFDNFVHVLRPFIMGYYDNHELERAFAILDRNHSGYIVLDELAAFLRIINPEATDSTLRNYIRKVNMNSDGSLNYEQFRALILKRIGRDIICNNL